MHFAVKVLLLLTPWAISARALSKSKHARLSLADPMSSTYFNRIDGNAGTYDFGFDVSDSTSGNSQYRNEKRYPNGTVVGSYGYLDPNGKPRRYRYIADHKGYRVMRERPFTSSSSAIINQINNPHLYQNEVTWTRKKTNGAITTANIKRNLEEKKFLQNPFRYFYH